MIQLRDLESDDKQLLVHYLNNPQLVRYLSSKIPQPYTVEDASWWIEVGCKEGAFVKAIMVDDIFCGVVGIYKQECEYAHAAELGYWVAQKYWNKGVASRAVVEFTELVFSTTDIQRIYNPVTSANIASIKVMMKAGYSLEGIMRHAVKQQGQFYDEHVFAKVRD